MIPTKGDVGKCIRAKREGRGWDREALAARIARAASTVKSWELGRTVPDVIDLFRLCEVFDCDPKVFSRMDTKTTGQAGDSSAA